MNKHFFIIMSAIVFSVFMTACTTSIRQNDLLSPDAKKLERGKVIAITPVEDGMFNGQVYYGSGANVANMFLVNSKPYSSKSVTAANIEKAAEAGAYYLIKPTILHWEPRAAAWSAISTKVTIHVSVYRISDGREIMSKNLDTKGRALTFASQSAEGLAGITVKQFFTNAF